MKYLYLLINVLSVLFPLLFSFHKGMRWIKHFKHIIISMIIVAVLYLVWDIYFTKNGIWGFNLDYCLGITFFGMPLEEYLFFICIPYASLFIHYSLQYFSPKVLLPLPFTRALTIVLLIGALVMSVVFYEKAYTVVNFSILLLSLIAALRFNIDVMRRFYISFIFILIPFIIVNGILTGSWIDEPVVWYNNAENLHIRVLTIPVEDFAYAMSMLLLNLLLIEYFISKKIA